MKTEPKNSSLSGSGLSILNQSVVSASNFMVMLFVAKAMTPDQFAIYVLLFNGLVVLAGVQVSLIIGPFRIYGVGLQDSDIYVNSVRRLQVGLSFALIILLLAVALVVQMGNHALVVSYCICILCYQLYELKRAECFVSVKMKRLFVLDLAVHGIRMLILMSMLYMDALTIEVVLLSVVATSVLGLLFPPSYNGGIFYKRCLGERDAIKKNWNYGRWLLVETFLFTVSQYFYLYVVAFALTADDTAGFAAAQAIISVLNVILIALTNYSTSIARQYVLQGRYDAWKQYLFRVGVAMAVSTISLVGVLSAFSNSLMELLYTDFYTQYSPLVAILGMAFAIQGVNGVIGVAFRTLEKPQVGFYAKLVSAIVALLFAYPLISTFGVMGAAVGMLITQFVWLFVYVAYLCFGAIAREKITALSEAKDNV